MLASALEAMPRSTRPVDRLQSLAQGHRLESQVHRLQRQRTAHQKRLQWSSQPAWSPHGADSAQADPRRQGRPSVDRDIGESSNQGYHNQTAALPLKDQRAKLMAEAKQLAEKVDKQTK
eukprot:2777622-Amphidinium_carterae.1